MKNYYEEPVVEIIAFEAADVVTTSGENEDMPNFSGDACIS